MKKTEAIVWFLKEQHVIARQFRIAVQQVAATHAMFEDVPYLQPDMSAIPICHTTSQLAIPDAYDVGGTLTNTLPNRGAIVDPHFWKETKGRDSLIIDPVVGQAFEPPTSYTPAIHAVRSAGLSGFIIHEATEVPGLYCLIATRYECATAGLVYQQNGYSFDR